MEEEKELINDITSDDDLVENIDKAETNEDIDKINKKLDESIEKLFDEKYTSEEHIFELKELTEEDKKLLTKEEIEIYNTAVKLRNDEEKKEINLLEEFKDKLMDEEIALLSVNNKDAEEEIRSRLILEGLGVATKLEENKFKYKADKILKTTYPAAIVNQYFRLNAKRFEVTDETENTEEAIEKAKSYYYTIGIKKLLDMSKNELFLSRLIKQCSDKRYKRHVEDIDFFIGKAIGNNETARKSSVNSVKKLDENIRKVFFKHFKIDIWKLDEKYNHAISRSYCYAVSEVARKSNIRSNDMIEIYFYNANVAVFTMMGSKDTHEDLKDDAKICYDYIYTFIENIYNYFKNKK